MKFPGCFAGKWKTFIFDGWGKKGKHKSDTSTFSFFELEMCIRKQKKMPARSTVEVIHGEACQWKCTEWHQLSGTWGKT